MAKVDEIVVGDEVRITNEDYDCGLSTGNVYRVIRILEGVGNTRKYFLTEPISGTRLDICNRDIRGLIFLENGSFEIVDSFAHWVREVRQQAGV